jgi:hypothetical protein
MEKSFRIQPVPHLKQNPGIHGMTTMNFDDVFPSLYLFKKDDMRLDNAI